MSRETDVLDTLGIPYAINGYEPKMPPRNKPYYATVSRQVRDDGSDESVMFRRVFSLISLYDAGTPDGVDMRNKLHEALSDANLKHSMSRTEYFSSEKVFMTEYDIEQYIEKR